MDQLKAIAEKNEKRILQILTLGPKTWEELKNETGFAPSTLSKHLKRLLERGLIAEEISKVDRRKKIYRLSSFDAIRDELISLGYFILLINVSSHLLKTLDREKFVEELKDMIGSFLIATSPSIQRGFKALELFLKLHYPFFEDYNDLMKEALIRIELQETEDLLKDTRSKLKEMILSFLALTKPSVEEMKNVIGKYFDKPDEALEVILKWRRVGEEFLKTVENLWISKTIEIKEEEIPPFEEFIQSLINK